MNKLTKNEHELLDKLVWFLDHDDLKVSNRAQDLYNITVRIVQDRLDRDKVTTKGVT